MNNMNTHLCPGCGVEVKNYLFACYRCWDPLPDRLKERVRATASRPLLDDKRMQVISDVMEWYNSHPVGAR